MGATRADIDQAAGDKLSRVYFDLVHESWEAVSVKARSVMCVDVMLSGSSQSENLFKIELGDTIGWRISNALATVAWNACRRRRYTGIRQCVPSRVVPKVMTE